jgi:hypothetical protein
MVKSTLEKEEEVKEEEVDSRALKCLKGLDIYIAHAYNLRYLEVEIGRLTAQGQSGQIAREIPSSK